MPQDTMRELLDEYARFHSIVENTPRNLDNSVEHYMGYGFERILHGAIGLSTEAAEILDPFKKNLYGKRKPLDSATCANLREECGDVFFYLWLIMDALDYRFESMLEDNINKLAKRYNVSRENEQ